MLTSWNTFSDFVKSLATNENETEVITPDLVRAAVVAEEPRTIVITLDAEHVEVATRVRNGFHDHDDPFVHGLVGVLQTQLRANLCGTELKTEFDGLVADLLVGRTTLEAEFSHRHVDQVDFLLGVACLEGRLADDVVRPVADFHSSSLDGLLEVVARLGAHTELDGLPRREGLELVRYPATVAEELRELKPCIVRTVDERLNHTWVKCIPFRIRAQLGEQLEPLLYTDCLGSHWLPPFLCSLPPPQHAKKANRYSKYSLHYAYLKKYCQPYNPVSFSDSLITLIASFLWSDIALIISTSHSLVSKNCFSASFSGT